MAQNTEIYTHGQLASRYQLAPAHHLPHPFLLLAAVVIHSVQSTSGHTPILHLALCGPEKRH